MKPATAVMAAVLAAAGTPATPGPEGRRAEAGPPAATEIENNAVKVVRLRLAPHQRIPMHDLSPRVVVYLTDAHLRLTYPDGTTREQHERAGRAEWLDAQRHAGENLGNAPIELLAIVPVPR